MSGKTAKAIRKKFDQYSVRVMKGFIDNLKHRTLKERIRAAWSILIGAKK